MVQVLHGNLIKQEVEGIINSANSQLQHNGGVARAIAEAAGPYFLQECAALSSDSIFPAGTAVQTGSGVLPFKAIIHAVPPHYTDTGKSYMSL